MLRRVKFWVVIAALLCTFTVCGAAEHPAQFPPPVDSYRDAQLSLGAKLRQRAAAEPLNLVATIIFGLAIIHTFLAPKIMHVEPSFNGTLEVHFTSQQGRFYFLQYSDDLIRWTIDPIRMTGTGPLTIVPAHKVGTKCFYRVLLIP